MKEIVNIACMFLFSLEVVTYSIYQTTATYTPVLESLDIVLAHLDVILRYDLIGFLTYDVDKWWPSLAHVSAHSPEVYVKPKVIEKGTLPWLARFYVMRLMRG